MRAPSVSSRLGKPSAQRSVDLFIALDEEEETFLVSWVTVFWFMRVVSLRLYRVACRGREDFRFQDGFKH